MDVTYGDGMFIDGNQKFQGRIILSEHKLFFRKDNEDIAQTFIPLEKIRKITRSGKGIWVFVRLSQTNVHKVLMIGKHKLIKELVEEIVKRRGFKKKILRKEWIDPNY